MNRIDNLIDSLENTKEIIELKKVNEKVKQDQELQKLLKEYSLYPKENIKKEIIENTTFQEYKEKETDINILIMKINQKLKEISQKEDCSL